MSSRKKPDVSNAFAASLMPEAATTADHKDPVFPVSSLLKIVSGSFSRMTRSIYCTFISIFASESFEAAKQVPVLTPGDLVLQKKQPLDEGFRPGRTPWNYDVHRDDKMGSRHYRILAVILEG